ncbi:hypothetical protein Q3G72_002910 [Acer saccharum]|nr:hypothetical protein Q3G72_002910 [Acer saccharum]
MSPINSFHRSPSLSSSSSSFTGLFSLTLLSNSQQSQHLYRKGLYSSKCQREKLCLKSSISKCELQSRSQAPVPASSFTVNLEYCCLLVI